MDGHRTHHQRHHGVRWNTQGQQRNEGGLRASVVGRLRRCHTTDVALTKRYFTRLQLGLLLDGVGSKGRQHRAATGQDTQRGTQSRTTHHGGEHALHVLGSRHQALDLGREDFTLVFWLGQVGDDFTVTEHTHGDHNKVDTVGQFGNVKAVTCHAGVHVRADHAEQQTQHDHANRLEQRAGSQHHGTNQTQHHQREILGRAEHEGHFGQRRCKGSQDDGAHATCEERTDTGSRQRRARTAFTRHLVAVDHGHHRRGLTRQVHQNRSGRAAVLCAVVNTGQHDQRRHRRQGVGRRQQHRNRCDRAQTRQDADQRTQDTADQAVDQVLGREGDPEAQR